MEIHGFTESGCIDATIDGQRMSVPDDPANRHRQMIAEWEAAGNAIPAYVPPPAPMPSLEPWQFFAMLDLSGKRPDLEAFIDAMQEPAKTVAKSQYHHSKLYRRDNPLVLVAQQALGLTDDALDALWQQAANLSL